MKPVDVMPMGLVMLLLFVSASELRAQSSAPATDDDPAVLFQKARAHDRAGETDLAIRILSQLRKTYPHDIDYALARAQILADEERDAEALDDLRDAVTLDPDYEDVWRLQFTLLARQQGDATRLEFEKFMHAVAAQFPDATWWRGGAIDPTVRWSILAGIGRQELSDGLPAWNEQFFEIAREQDPWGRYRVGLARNERFENADRSVLLGGDVSFASNWFAGLSTTFTSNAEFQPKLEWNANLGKALDDGWVLSFRYRNRNYQDTDVGSATGIVEKYVRDYRIAYAIGASRLPGAPTLLNHGLTVNWYYKADSSLGITINSGKEAEVIGPGQVLETNVRGLSLVGRQRLTDRLGLQWWLGLHDQGDFYRRDYFGLAVSIKL